MNAWQNHQSLSSVIFRELLAPGSPAQLHMSDAQLSQHVHGPVAVMGDVTAPGSPPVHTRPHESWPVAPVTTQPLAQGPSMVCMSHLWGLVICPASRCVSRMHLLAFGPRTVTHGGWRLRQVCLIAICATLDLLLQTLLHSHLSQPCRNPPRSWILSSAVSCRQWWS